MTSETVLEEAIVGDANQNRLRLGSLEGVRILGPSEEVEFIGGKLARKG